MDRLHIAICEDEAYFREGLLQGVVRYLAARGLEAEPEGFPSGEVLLRTGRAFDIALMDVCLPGGSGVEVAARLRETGRVGQIIFITAHEQYALQAFALDAAHYCVKPVSDEQLREALDRALGRAGGDDGAALTIAEGGDFRRIYLRDILFCEAMDHKIYIHTAAGSYGCFGTLGHLQTKLDGRFFRCHKSYIVNLRAVASKGRDSATLVDGREILVSRRRQSAFARILLTSLRQEVL